MDEMDENKKVIKTELTEAEAHRLHEFLSTHAHLAIGYMRGTVVNVRDSIREQYEKIEQPTE